VRTEEMMHHVVAESKMTLQIHGKMYVPWKMWSLMRIKWKHSF